MPVSHEEHCRVTMAVSIASSGFDQLLNFGLGEVFSAPELTVRPAQWSNCSFFDGGLDQLACSVLLAFLASPHSQLLVQDTLYEQSPLPRRAA